jgi:stage III sporulation protein SpoIIIAA
VLGQSVLGQPPTVTDDLDALLAALPPEIADRLRTLPPARDFIELVMDLGRRPEARFGTGGEEVLLDREIAEEDLRYVVDHVGDFGDDNRAGIERTLHRISAIRNRAGKIVGLTCRVGRAVFGTIEIIEDLVESGRSILIMGRPGIGKTTMLREAARVLADKLDKRVVVVDTSNEIAGDGDIPHPGIGRARRMQVKTPTLQHAVMIEAVENHMPEVIVIDEIGTELEALAARTIAERGVQLIGTAHGNTLENLMLNPTLSDLIGGIQTVTLGDEEARRRRTQKSVLERKAPPTFDVVVEIQERDRVMVHPNVADSVDALLRGDPIAPELRWRDEAGVHRSQAGPRPAPSRGLVDRFAGLVGNGMWRVEPGWRGDAGYRATAPWGAREARAGPGGRSGGASGRGGHGHEGSGRGSGYLAGGSAFHRAGEVADRGPVERGSVPPADLRERDLRELEREQVWRESAERALEEPAKSEAGKSSSGGPDVATATLEAGDETPSEVRAPAPYDRFGHLAPDGYPTSLPTLRVLGFGISRKRLEQAVRELQLPVVVVREAEEADVVITLRTYYRQKPGAIRDAEERAIPIYVLKSNTIIQMEACLTSLFAIEVDPREAALRETEEAIGIVMERSEPVELSPQNAYVRRLQHQMAERANVVSQSKGREPFRRVRLYPDRSDRRSWR